MTKKQWKNLWRSFRWMRSSTDSAIALAWIAFNNVNDAALLRRVLG